MLNKLHFVRIAFMKLTFLATQMFILWKSFIYFVTYFQSNFIRKRFLHKAIDITLFFTSQLRKKQVHFVVVFLIVQQIKLASFIYFLKGIDTKKDNENGQSSNYKNKTPKKMPN